MSVKFKFKILICDSFQLNVSTTIVTFDFYYGQVETKSLILSTLLLTEQTTNKKKNLCSLYGFTKCT